MKYLHDLWSTFQSLDTSTTMLLSLIVGSALWIVKDKVASVFTLLMMGPVALAISASAYSAFLVLGLFNIKNMGEWLIWTISAGTIGMGVVLCAAATLSSMSDRKEAQVAAR